MILRLPSHALLGAVLLALAGCAVSEIPTSVIAPRYVQVEGTAARRWEASQGWVVSEDGAWGADEQIRLESRKAFDEGYFADALVGFLELEDRGVARVSKELNYYLGECYYQLGHYEEAIEHFRLTYRTDFPSEQLVDTARERVFEMGMAYLAGKKTLTLFGIEYTSPEHGIDILFDPAEGLITENPHLSFAPEGLIAIADHYFREEQYPEAIPLYERIGEMEIAKLEQKDYAEYHSAMAEFLQVRGVSYDQSKMLEAQARFRRYLKLFSQGSYAEKARERLRKISEWESEKNLEIAKFYLNDSQPRACEIYLRIVLDRHPNSRAAREAREIRRQLDRTRGSW